MTDQSSWHPSDVELMLNLIKLGCNLDEVREIEHFFIAPDKNAVALILQALPKIGQRLQHISDYDEEEGNYLVCSVEMNSPSEVTRRTEKITQLAKLYNSFYDGWATSV
jgi:regulator of RNase E activity RraB